MTQVNRAAASERIKRKKESRSGKGVIDLSAASEEKKKKKKKPFIMEACQKRMHICMCVSAQRHH